MTRATQPAPGERGKRASFDRRTGEVHGSGSGAGGGNPGEDYDTDDAAGAGTEPPDQEAGDRGSRPSRHVRT